MFKNESRDTPTLQPAPSVLQDYIRFAVQLQLPFLQLYTFQPAIQHFSLPRI